jgi:hypothetical protein
LRREIANALRARANEERVGVACGSCGEVIDVSPSHFQKVRTGRMPAPLCFDRRRPTRAAEAEAEAVAWVELLGELAEELEELGASASAGQRLPRPGRHDFHERPSRIRSESAEKRPDEAAGRVVGQPPPNPGLPLGVTRLDQKTCALVGPDACLNAVTPALTQTLAGQAS